MEDLQEDLSSVQVWCCSLQSGLRCACTSARGLCHGSMSLSAVEAGLGISRCCLPCLQEWHLYKCTK